MSIQQVENAARQTLGSVPSSWQLSKISERLEQLKPLSEQPVVVVQGGLLPPPSTYMLWLMRTKGISYVFYQASVLSEASITAFEQTYEDMAREARLTAELDVANFVAEQDIASIMQILQGSVLAISALYRYIAAQENSMEFVLTDDVILKAIKELRSNPYLFFVYGESAKNLMPVLWEDL